MKSGRFREFWQCDFDIAGVAADMVADAEVVQVVDSVLRKLDIGRYLIKINHRKLLEAMFAASGCDLAKFGLICSSIDKLDKETWAHVSRELLDKQIPAESVDKLKAFVLNRGAPAEMLTWLEASELVATEVGRQAIADLKALAANLDAMGALANCSFDLSLARGLD